MDIWNIIDDIEKDIEAGESKFETEKKLVYDVNYTTGNCDDNKFNVHYQVWQTESVYDCKITVDKEYVFGNTKYHGHPFECIAKKDDENRVCFSEAIAKNPMTTELVKLLSLPDEELKQHFFNDNVGSYRARLIYIYNYLWL